MEETELKIQGILIFENFLSLSNQDNFMECLHFLLEIFLLGKKPAQNNFAACKYDLVHVI